MVFRTGRLLKTLVLDKAVWPALSSVRNIYIRKENGDIPTPPRECKQKPGNSSKLAPTHSTSSVALSSGLSGVYCSHYKRKRKDERRLLAKYMMDLKQRNLNS